MAMKQTDRMNFNKKDKEAKRQEKRQAKTARRAAKKDAASK
jgi:hypothetical protein